MSSHGSGTYPWEASKNGKVSSVSVAVHGQHCLPLLLPSAGISAAPDRSVVTGALKQSIKEEVCGIALLASADLCRGRAHAQQGASGELCVSLLLASLCVSESGAWCRHGVVQRRPVCVERRHKRVVDCERGTFVCWQPSGDDPGPYIVGWVNAWYRCVAEVHVLAEVSARSQ